MAIFDVLGPFEVPTETRPGGRVIDRKAIAEFWEAAGCGDDVGCYVFGIVSGNGSLPYYAGRTTKSFADECFQLHKREKYRDALSRVRRGKPVMFFAVLKRGRGKVNASAISALEEQLIGLGTHRNMHMSNISKTRTHDIVVKGVMGSGRGAPKRAARAFKKMFHL